MAHDKNKKILAIVSCLCTICVTSCIVGVIPQYSKSYLSSTSIQHIAKKLEQLIKNPIIISSDLTASQALYEDNYEIVTKLILNKIQDDLGGSSLTINGISYSTSNIIKDLKIILPSTVSYDDYLSGSISGVKIEYVTSNQIIDITTNNNSSYTVQGFLVPNISSTNQTIANILSLHIKNPIQINDALNASQALQTNNIVNTIEQIKASIRNDCNNKDITINNNITIPINELLNNINITLPSTITSSELDSGIINNVVLKYESNNNITNIIASNGSKTFTVKGFNIPNNNETQLQNTAIANELDKLIKNPIIILSNLTVSEALYQDNYEIVTKLILNKIQDDLGDHSLTINGISYPTSNIIKNLKIILPSTVSYVDYQTGSISGVKIEYVTSNQIIDITTNKNSSYTVQGFLVPSISSTNQTIANILSLYIKNPIQINDSLNASQALQTNNIANTIDEIKATIRSDLNNKDITINNNITIPINELLNNINITLPSTITSSELDSGIINNVVLKYESNNNITNIIASNGSKTFTVKGFNIPNNNETQLQNTAIVNELDKLIKNPIVLLDGYNLTAAQSVSSNTNKQTLFNAIKEVIKDELGTNFIINSVSYETSEILQNITINVPNSITISQNNDQTIPNVTLFYKNIELKNSNGINYTVTNLAEVTNENTNQAAQNEKIAQQLSQMIKNPIQLSNGYYYSAQQTLSNSNNISSFEQAILISISNYINVNEIVVDGLSYSKYTIVNNIHVSVLLQGVTYSQNEQVQVNNIIALYYGGNVDSLVSKPIYNSSSTDSWDVTGFNIQNINNTNWKSLNNNIAMQLSSMIYNPIYILSNHTVKEYVTLYNDLLKNAISYSACYGDVTTFYLDGLKITPQEVYEYLIVQLPNIEDITEAENDNAELNNVHLTYDYPQNSENNAASIIPSGASSWTVEGFQIPQQIQQNKAIANYLSSIIPNPIVLPYNSNYKNAIWYNATYPFPIVPVDNIKFSGNAISNNNFFVPNNLLSPFSVFKNEIISIISNNIKTDNIPINGIIYSKNDILQKIHITLLIKGVTIAQIQSGNVNNMIGIFYGENSNENLTPIYNSSHINSWDVYSFTPINEHFLYNNLNSTWYAPAYLTSYLSIKLNGPYKITSIYTAQEYCNAWNNYVQNMSYNKEILDSINNSIMDEVANLIPNKVILFGIIYTKDEILDNLTLADTYIGWKLTLNSSNQVSGIMFKFNCIIQDGAEYDNIVFLLKNENVIFIKPKEIK